MNIKVYISVNTLPNTNYILSLLLNRLEKANSRCEINIIHDSLFNFTLFENLTNLNLKFKLSDDNLYEYPALRNVWADSKNEDFYALYLHVKGASKISYKDIQNSIAWLDYMLFGLLDNLNLCMYHLNNGADIVGSMWYNHFKGNFFWCKSSYVKTLLDPYKFTISDRFNAEYWISMPFDNHWFNASKELYGLELKYPKIKNLFYLPINSDFDFIKLKNNNYLPSLNEKISANSMSDIIGNPFIAYDKLCITDKEFNQFATQLLPYCNYDATITKY